MIVSLTSARCSSVGAIVDPSSRRAECVHASLGVSGLAASGPASEDPSVATDPICRRHVQRKKAGEPMEERTSALEFTGLQAHRGVKRWDGGRTDLQPTVAR